MSTLSRLISGVRSWNAPDWQNLPTLSVVNDTATSGGFPDRMPAVILSSSWPDTAFTVMFGCASWNSDSILLNAFTSLALLPKPCQMVSVCCSVTAGPLVCCWGLPAVQPATRSARAAPVGTAIRRWERTGYSSQLGGLGVPQADGQAKVRPKTAFRAADRARCRAPRSTGFPSTEQIFRRGRPMAVGACDDGGQVDHRGGGARPAVAGRAQR